ncbi:FAD-dependent oxidoreductase [Phyllobacterium sp. 628]|uniref:FAD-dependent oxidoreductase n=1 Tax=Phyllobacterium sp. 628 TaxID=2718938 RepID=UPI001FCEE701|nr:FAD-dependent oxidoreductase [Phyllobacterium sp. 628]
MKTEYDVDILICGAGASGLTMALELARRGITFRIIEKLDDPFRGSRGKGIQPRTQEIFEDLGILDKIVAVGGVYPKQRAYRDDESFVDSDVVEDVGSSPSEPYHIPLMVPQFLTERVMRDRLAEFGLYPEFGCELLAFDEAKGVVTARIARRSGETTIRARYLVGADGGRSFVRHALGIGFPGKTLGVRAIVADVTLTGLGREVWHRFGEGDMQRQIAICPLAGTDMFQVQGPIPLEGEIDLSAEGLTALVAERTGRSDIAVLSVSWASAFNMNARLADHYRVGCTFLVGDAAHTHPPTGGQGLNTSVQDAYNLAWKLAAVIDGGDDSLLDSYEAERRPVAEAMLGLSTGLLDAMKRGDIRRGRSVHQLDIGYPESVLSTEIPPRLGGLLAGDRAPDAPLMAAAGQPRRLFDLLTGPHWTLITYAARQEASSKSRRGLTVHHVGPDGDLMDNGGHFNRAYGIVDGGTVIIRPDGYVGAIFGKDASSEIDSYLARVGLGQEA